MFNDIVPKNFNDFILNKNILYKFKCYNINNLYNLIIYGYGKKTTLNSFLLYLFDTDYIHTNIQKYKIKINNNDITLNIKQSKYYYEINLYEYGFYDKYIICTFIKELISTKNVNNNNYKIIILNYFDNISKQAQLSLRRLMELYINNCRFIITTKTLDNIEKALISRCDLIRIPYPNNIEQYLNFCEHKLNKKINKHKILSKSGKCLFKLNTLILYEDYIPPVYIFVKQIHDIIVKSKNILFIDEIRNIIYKIHLLNIGISEVLNTYIDYVIKDKLFPDEIIVKIVNQAALNQLKATQITKYFFCLERFFIFIKRCL